MNKRYAFISVFFALFVAFFCSQAPKSAIDSITEKELHKHLAYIASAEMKGRNTPSPELKKAAEYIVNEVKSYGLKPILPDESYLQRIDLEKNEVDGNGTVMNVSANGKTASFKPFDDFIVTAQEDIKISGNIVFVGYGMAIDDIGWNDFKDANGKAIDLTGKIVIMLDGNLPADHAAMDNKYRRNRRYRQYMPFRSGALAVMMVNNNEKEREMAGGDVKFESSSRAVPLFMKNDNSRRRFRMNFIMGKMKQSVAASILGISVNDIAGMFDALKKGSRVMPVTDCKSTVSIDVKMKSVPDYTQNVVAYIEGTDPQLKNEYVILGAHYDHIGVNPDGQINYGADDNGSGTVALLELAQAFMMQKPKRSVIWVWHAGEEKGLWGAHYFVKNPPIDLKKVSAMLQIDMCSRNAPDSLFLIGSHFQSQEMHDITLKANEKSAHFGLNMLYNVKGKPRNYYHNSDHYAYGQYGIPVTFYFSGIHEDLHNPGDTVDKCDFTKIKKTAQLVFTACTDIANLDHMLILNDGAVPRGTFDPNN